MRKDEGFLYDLILSICERVAMMSMESDVFWLPAFTLLFGRINLLSGLPVRLRPDNRLSGAIGNYGGQWHSDFATPSRSYDRDKVVTCPEACVSFDFRMT
jgi:hypothetical protein